MELLISMTIFIIFVGILINSYTYIVKSQREANDYRQLYAEARHVFDKLTEEIRAGSIYYPPEFTAEYNSPADELLLLRPETSGGLLNEDIGLVKFKLNDEILDYCNNSDVGGVFGEVYKLNSGGEDGVSIKEFSVYVSPAADPYANTFADGVQFQPKVTVFARFEKPRTIGEGVFGIDMQTTVSSRFYGPVLWKGAVGNCSSI